MLVFPNLIWNHIKMWRISNLMDNRIVCSALLGALVFPAILAGQTNSLAYQLANLTEDVRILDERIRAMQMDLEAMRRENSQLRKTVATYESNIDSSLSNLATLSYIEEALQKVVGQLERRDETIKRETLLEVTKQIQAFAKTVNKTIGNLSSNTSNPVEKKPIEFHDNWPRTGINYTVQSGDNLSSIAKQHDSKIEWIQHANKIVSPRALQVGQKLFIPQQ